jgi:hypothetical protein
MNDVYCFRKFSAFMHTKNFGFYRSLQAVAPLTVTFVVGALGCSQVNDTAALRQAAPERALSVVETKLTTACRLDTVGLPCDPDGAGEATECEGLCWVGDDAEVGCLPLADAGLVQTDLNGRICGDQQGRDCSRSCENGACVEKNARLGTACRPGANTTTCDGVCTLVGGQPVCDEIAVCSEVGIADDGCTLKACNFENFELGCHDIQLTNAVCEASQAELDSGLTADAASLDASLSDAAIDSGLSAPTSVADAAASTTSSGRTTAQVGTSSAVDAAVPDAGVRPRTPTRVVGGACNVASGRNPGVSSIVLVLLGLLVARRKR